MTVGLRPGGPTEAKAKADGFLVKTPAEAVKDADLVAVLTPDMVQKKLYDEVLKDNLKPGACLLFAHGLNAVSYTHLDVYKRQIQGHRVLEGFEAGDGTRQDRRVFTAIPAMAQLHRHAPGTQEQLLTVRMRGQGGTLSLIHI